MYHQHLLFLLSSLISVRYGTAVAPAGPWDTFNFAPSSRTVHPKTIHSTHGLVQDSSQLVVNTRGQATLNGNGSYVVLDFGQEVRKFDIFHNLSLIFLRNTTLPGPYLGRRRVVSNLKQSSTRLGPFPIVHRIFAIHQSHQFRRLVPYHTGTQWRWGPVPSFSVGRWYLHPVYRPTTRWIQVSHHRLQLRCSRHDIQRFPS